jgi:hypothetical protein
MPANKTTDGNACELWPGGDLGRLAIGSHYSTIQVLEPYQSVDKDQPFVYRGPSLRPWSCWPIARSRRWACPSPRGHGVASQLGLDNLAAPPSKGLGPQPEAR